MQRNRVLLSDRVGARLALSLGIALLGLALPLTRQARAEDPVPAWQWTADTAKPRLLPGEPAVIRIHCHNPATVDRGIAYDFRNLSFELWRRTDQGEVLVQRADPFRRDGLLGPQIIPAGQTGDLTVVLNRWLSTRVPAGNCIVKCRIENSIDWHWRESVAERRDLTFLPTAEVTTEITILPADDKRMKEIIASIAAQAFPTDDEVPQDTVSEAARKRAVFKEMLIYAETPHADRARVRMLRGSLGGDHQSDIYRKLQHSSDPAVALELIRLINHPEETAQMTLMRTDRTSETIRLFSPALATEVIYRMRDNPKAGALRNATEPFVKTYSRPPEYAEPLIRPSEANPEQTGIQD